MTASRDPDRLIRAFLDEGMTELPDRAYDAVRYRVDHSRQRVVIGPWRTFGMNNTARLLIAAAAVVVVAVIAVNFLPGTGTGVGGPPPTPSVTPAPTSTPTPGPTSAAAWPTGTLAAGVLSTSLTLCDPRGRPCNDRPIAFSFDLPTGGWTPDLPGSLSNDQAWLTFLGPIAAVSTDPCAGQSTPVGPSIDEMAAAVTTIPGTDATGPTDVTVGGRPGQLVTLTIQTDLPCALSEYWLYGNVSFYPSEPTSKIELRFVDVDGQPFVFSSDQFRPTAELEAQIQHIADSISFE